MHFKYQLQSNAFQKTTHHCSPWAVPLEARAVGYANEQSQNNCHCKKIKEN
jgi:hypothetical protein